MKLVAGNGEMITNKRAYDLGWDDGRAGRPMYPGATHYSYRQGWIDGECALECAENGCGWREDEGYHY